MTEPTDTAIDTLILEHGVMGQAWPTQRQLHAFARAVHAKWGNPAPVGVEPVASVHRDSLAMLNSGQVRPWGGGARLYPASKARFDETYVGVYTSPQPTQAQAGAVSLTDEQIDAAAKKLAECMEYPWEYMPEPGRKNMRKHAQAVLEATHGIGIKGGQRDS